MARGGRRADESSAAAYVRGDASLVSLSNTEGAGMSQAEQLVALTQAYEGDPVGLASAVNALYAGTPEPDEGSAQLTRDDVEGAKLELAAYLGAAKPDPVSAEFEAEREVYRLGLEHLRAVGRAWHRKVGGW